MAEEEGGRQSRIRRVFQEDLVFPIICPGQYAIPYFNRIGIFGKARLDLNLLYKSG
jgi:hypothetical protein